MKKNDLSELCAVTSSISQIDLIGWAAIYRVNRCVEFMMTAQTPQSRENT